ncbi:hypothetical protein L3X38_010522 [Prunus dulcis]|uniref:Uncharacterized protein n=1 Tax=Prunus dulcis TaxID=3755 RepID=A0AAD4WI59_PRUDU|nr:hypothetical protein L3X38_010522 [Prunus dulcis]
MVTTKRMEEIVSDSDLPIIGLKKKSSMENLPTSTPTPKIEVKTSVKEKKNHEESIAEIIFGFLRSIFYFYIPPLAILLLATRTAVGDVTENQGTEWGIREK